VKDRVVHWCVPAYELVQWVTTTASGDVTVGGQATSSNTCFYPPVHRVQTGLRPICGAPVRPNTDRRRVSDFAGRPCKRCARMVKKRDRRKKNRGYSARRNSEDAP
jgi:hypothetical protein